MLQDSARNLKLYYNCRFLIMSASLVTKEFFQNIFEQHKIKGYKFLETIASFDKLIQQSLMNQLHYHFILLDQVSFKQEQIEEMYNLVREHRAYGKTPIVVLEKDLAVVDESIVEEQEVRDDNLEIDDQKKDHLVCQITADENVRYISRPLAVESIFDPLEELYYSCFPGGISAVKCLYKNDHCIVSLPPKYDDLVALELTLLLRNVSRNDKYQLIVLDFEQVDSLDQLQFRLIFQAVIPVKKTKKILCSINVTEEITEKINALSANDAFRICKNIQEAFKKGNLIKENPKSKPSNKYASINADIVNPFLGSTIRVMQSKTKLVIRPLSPKINTGEIKQVLFFATAIVIKSPQFSGKIFQVFDKDVFKKFFNIMAKENNIKDTNHLLIFTHGMLKDIFEESKKHILKTLNLDMSDAQISPNVYYGHEKILNVIKSDSPSISIPMNSGIGTIDLIVTGE